MRIIYSVCLSMIFSAYMAGNTYAADDLGDLDITIRVIDSKQNINEFINRIELPRGVADAKPPADGQTLETNKESSNTRRESENASHNRQGAEKNGSDRQNNSDHDEDKIGQQNQQIELRAPEASSMTDNNQIDSRDHRNRDAGTREQRETARDTSRRNWN